MAYEEVYEYQRWSPQKKKWLNGLKADDSEQWTSGDTGKPCDRPEKLGPPAGWRWIGEWEIKEGTSTGGGWLYATSKEGPYYPVNTGRYSVRRRRWTRKRKAADEEDLISPPPKASRPDLSQNAFVNSPSADGWDAPNFPADDWSGEVATTDLSLLSALDGFSVGTTPLDQARWEVAQRDEDIAELQARLDDMATKCRNRERLCESYLSQIEALQRLNKSLMTDGHDSKGLPDVVSTSSRNAAQTIMFIKGSIVLDDSQVDALSRQMRNSHFGVELRDRGSFFSKATNAFVGSEAVDWFLATQRFETSSAARRDEARQLGQFLLDNNVFVESSGATVFKDDPSSFYQFPAVSVESLEQRIDSLHSERQNLMHTVADLEKINVQLKTEKEELRALVSSRNDILEVMDADISKLKREKADVEDRLTAACSKIKDLEDVVNNLQEEAATAELSKANASKKEEELEHKLVEVQDENRKELERAKAECDEVNSELSETLATLKKVEAALHEAEAKLASQEILVNVLKEEKKTAAQAERDLKRTTELLTYRLDSSSAETDGLVRKYAEQNESLTKENQDLRSQKAKLVQRMMEVENKMRKFKADLAQADKERERVVSEKDQKIQEVEASMMDVGRLMGVLKQEKQESLEHCNGLQRTIECLTTQVEEQMAQLEEKDRIIRSLKTAKPKV